VVFFVKRTPCMCETVYKLSDRLTLSNRQLRGVPKKTWTPKFGDNAFKSDNSLVACNFFYRNKWNEICKSFYIALYTAL